MVYSGVCEFTLSAILAKLDRDQMAKPTANIDTLTDDVMAALMNLTRSQFVQSESIISAKYVLDLMADEFEHDDDVNCTDESVTMPV